MPPRAKSASHRHSNPVPLCGFVAQLPSSRLCERVVFCAPIVFGNLPSRRQPARLFQAMERGKERARLNHEGSACDFIDPSEHAQAMELAGGERFEDQKDQGCLGVQREVSQASTPLISTCYTRRVAARKVPSE